ncbi:MAG: thermonuclease family protein, partial [Myxococcota bacterium]
VDVSRNGVDYTVRLRGIQAPELYSEPPEWLAAEAQSFVLDHVGFQVDLVFDAACDADPFLMCQDENGRVLSYVINQRGEDLGLRLLELGLAEVLHSEGETFDRLEAYVAAETRAREASLGLWAP